MPIGAVASGLLAAGILGLVAGPGSYLELFWIAGALAAIGAAILVVAHTVVERRFAAEGRR